MKNPSVRLIALITLFACSCGISENQVRAYLNSAEFHLKEDFKVIEDNSSSAPGDFVQTFQIQISEADMKEIVKQIREDKEFRDYTATEVVPDVFEYKKAQSVRHLAYQKDGLYNYATINEDLQGGYKSEVITINPKTKILDFQHVEE